MKKQKGNKKIDKTVVCKTKDSFRSQYSKFGKWIQIFCVLYCINSELQFLLCYRTTMVQMLGEGVIFIYSLCMILYCRRANRNLKNDVETKMLYQLYQIYDNAQDDYEKYNGLRRKISGGILGTEKERAANIGCAERELKISNWYNNKFIKCRKSVFSFITSVFVLVY